MNYPMPAYSDQIRKSTQTKFGGLNHNEGAGDGELYGMKNLCSDRYPLLATREKRRLFQTLTKGNGLFAWEKLCWVDGTKFYYNGEEKGSVEDSAKTFAAINGYIIIAPDMKYYNVNSGEFGSLGAKLEQLTLRFKDGTLYGEAATMNTIQGPTSVDWEDYFRVGDAVTISGCSDTALNQTLVIREISGNEMHFYEYSFGDGTYQLIVQYNVRIERKVPELKHMLENENRLWGCNDTTIYASKLGDPFNFFVYDGLETDSWAVDSGGAGTYTGAVSYLGYPTFFKEQKIYKVYGSMPSNFEVLGSATMGLAKGSGESLAVAGEALFYLNRNGVCMYTGGIPQPINRAFGMERYQNAAAGSDGLKYYISMQDKANDWHFFVYDTQRGMWHEEDGTHATHFAYSEGNLYMLDAAGSIWVTGNIQGMPGTEEADFDWFAEFTDFTDDSPNKKGISKLQIRADLDEDANLTVKLKMDSEGEWITPQDGIIEEKGKRSYYLAIIPQRADHYRMRIEGEGGCRIYSITREYYVGSELKSQPGRQ